jgi:hypothetical protein
MPAIPKRASHWTRPAQPLALVIFLENTGRLTGLNLSPRVMSVVDFVAEEYAKFSLWLNGVWRRYDKVLLLEDRRATGPELRAALIAASRTHRVDVLILAHGLPGVIVGYKGLHVGAETFGPLLDESRADPTLLNLRMVWQMNCYGATLAPMWRELGASSVNGSVGVNWMPEPAMSLFMRRWLRGEPYGIAVQKSHARSEQVWRSVYRKGTPETPHPRIGTSRPIVLGSDVEFGA